MNHELEHSPRSWLDDFTQWFSWCRPSARPSLFLTNYFLLGVYHPKIDDSSKLLFQFKYLGCSKILLNRKNTYCKLSAGIHGDTPRGLKILRGRQWKRPYGLILPIIVVGEAFTPFLEVGQTSNTIIHTLKIHFHTHVSQYYFIISYLVF